MHTASYRRASTNIQPRRNLPPLVSEFKQVLRQESQTPLPAHARLLSTPKRGYVASAKEIKDHQVTVGVRFSPEEFLTEAVRLCHPKEHSSLFPKEVRANIARLSSKTIHQLAKDRTEEVRRWVALSTELAAKEKGLKSSLSPRIAEVVKDKRLCLLATLLAKSGHEDLGLMTSRRVLTSQERCRDQEFSFRSFVQPAWLVKTLGKFQIIAVVSFWSRCRALETERQMSVFLRPLWKR